MTRKGKVWGVVGVVVGSLFFGLMLSCLVTIAIWPGEAELFAPLICDELHPDPVVVSDTYSTRPGETTTTFSLYCMGPRGDVVDEGWATVMLYATAAHTVLVLLVFLTLAVLAARRASARRGPAGEPPGEPPGGPDEPAAPTPPPLISRA